MLITIFFCEKRSDFFSCGFPCEITQLGRFSAPLTGQNSKSLVRDICTKFSITNLLLGNCVLGQYLGNVQNSLTKPILSQACKDFLIITKPHKFQFNFTKKKDIAINY